MELFRDGKEQDRHCIERLLAYHAEIVRATGGRLDARLEEAKPLPSTSGRPRKRWVLRVGPSEPLIGSSKPREFPPVGSS
jgi:hypothetical protein